MHIVWFDENGFKKAPGVIISCCMTKHALCAKETALQYLGQTISWGKVRSVGFRDGYVSYFDEDPAYLEYVPQDDPLYIQTVPQDIREKMAALVKGLRSGEILLPQTLEK